MSSRSPVKKTFVIAAISTHLDISVAAATWAANEWMKDHPDWRWEDLRSWVLDGDANFVDRQLVPAPLSTPEELETLRQQMLGTNGLDISDRRYRLRVYPDCFVGSEAVDWLVQTQDLSRVQAVQVGRRLVRRNIIRHVLDDQNFADEYYFYRFV